MNYLDELINETLDPLFNKLDEDVDDELAANAVDDYDDDGGSPAMSSPDNDAYNAYWQSIKSMEQAKAAILNTPDAVKSFIEFLKNKGALDNVFNGEEFNLDVNVKPYFTEWAIGYFAEHRHDIDSPILHKTDNSKKLKKVRDAEEALAIFEKAKASGALGNMWAKLDDLLKKDFTDEDYVKVIDAIDAGTSKSGAKGDASLKVLLPPKVREQLSNYFNNIKGSTQSQDELDKYEMFRVGPDDKYLFKTEAERAAFIAFLNGDPSTDDTIYTSPDIIRKHLLKLDKDGNPVKDKDGNNVFDEASRPTINNIIANIFKRCYVIRRAQKLYYYVAKSLDTPLPKGAKLLTPQEQKNIINVLAGQKTDARKAFDKAAREKRDAIRAAGGVGRKDARNYRWNASDPNKDGSLAGMPKAMTLGDFVVTMFDKAGIPEDPSGDDEKDAERNAKIMHDVGKKISRPNPKWKGRERSNVAIAGGDEIAADKSRNQGVTQSNVDDIEI